MKFNCLFSIVTSFLFITSYYSQDMFPVKQLTIDSAQEGFASWSPEGKILVYSHIAQKDSFEKTGLWIISVDGSGARQIFNDIAEHPKWSPDGSFIVFDADSGSSIKMIPAKGGEPIKFLPDSIRIVNGGMPCWSPDGSQIAFREGSKQSLCVYEIKTGKVVQIFRQDGMNPLPGCWTIDGKSILIALMEKQTRKCTLLEISSNGKVQKQITGHHENFYRHLALSPDGSLLIYATIESRYLGLWIMPAVGGKSIPLTVTKIAHNEGAVWSPNGKSIAFTSTRSGNFDIWIMNVDIEHIKKELRTLNE